MALRAGVGHEVVRADEADVHLARVAVGVVVEVDARGEVLAALGDLEVAVHVGPAAGMDLPRHRQEPAVVELGGVANDLARTPPTAPPAGPGALA